MFRVRRDKVRKRVVAVVRGRGIIVLVRVGRGGGGSGSSIAAVVVVVGGVSAVVLVLLVVVMVDVSGDCTDGAHVVGIVRTWLGETSFQTSFVASF